MTGHAADLRVLTEYRDQLVNERTATANRVHTDLGWLRPGYQHQLPHLTHTAHLHAAMGATKRRRQCPGRGDSEPAGPNADPHRAARRVADPDRRSGQSQWQHAARGLRDRPVVVATIIGHVSDVRRYPTRHHFATANGTAPIPASSGRTVRHRLNRGGNRQLNRALYTIAITQIRADTEGRAYYQRKRAEGKTSREALRCLKRRLSDLIYRTLRADLANAAQPTLTLSIAA